MHLIMYDHGNSSASTTIKIQAFLQSYFIDDNASYLYVAPGWQVTVYQDIQQRWRYSELSLQAYLI